MTARAEPSRAVLRSQMLSQGFGRSAIAVELRARFGDPPLKAWRHAHELTLEQAATALNELGLGTADGSNLKKWEQWPDAGRKPSITALVHLAALYRCPISALLGPQDLEARPEDEARRLHDMVAAENSSAPHPLSEALAGSAAAVRRALRDAAEESSLLTGRLEDSASLGKLSIEQIMADLSALATRYLTGDPVDHFTQTRALRDRIFAQFREHQPPRRAADLYVGAGYACGLLAWITSDLGNPAAADTHGRTAWACAEMADHSDLQAWVCSTRSKIALWDNRLADAVEHARRGTRFHIRGTAGVLLLHQEADALSMLGAAADAQTALNRANDASETIDGSDEIGGLLSCPPLRQANYRAAVHLRTRSPRLALAEAESALQLLTGQHRHAYGTTAQIHITRAGALAACGEPDEAVQALRPVLDLHPLQRLGPVYLRVKALSSVMNHHGGPSGRHATNTLEEWLSEAISHPHGSERSPSRPPSRIGSR